MMVTFEFRCGKRSELEHFVDKSRSHRAQYVALLQSLGITHQKWYYYTPKKDAPPDHLPKLVIWFNPDEPKIWSQFLELAKAPPLMHSQILQDAVRTLPVGTSSGPDFRPVWPSKDVYDCELLFEHPGP